MTPGGVTMTPEPVIEPVTESETHGSRKPRKAKDPPKVGISEEFLESMVARFSAPLAPRSVPEEIERALSHKAVLNYAYPQEAYVRGWLGREVKALGATNGRPQGGVPRPPPNQGGLIPPAPMPDGWHPETEEELSERISKRVAEMEARKALGLSIKWTPEGWENNGQSGR